VVGAEALLPNRIVAHPVFLTPGFICTGGQIRITTLEAGVNARIAVYKDRGNGQGPGVLLGDAGLTSLAAAGTATFNPNFTLPAGGLVWVCINNNSAGVARLAKATSIGYGIYGYTSAAPGAVEQYSVSRVFAFAAYPADESAQAYALGNDHPALIHLLNT
jgi:hypothetical protein